MKKYLIEELEEGEELHRGYISNPEQGVHEDVVGVEKGTRRRRKERELRARMPVRASATR